MCSACTVAASVRAVISHIPSSFIRPRIDAWRKERHENSTLTPEQIAAKTDAEHQFVKNDYDSTFDDMDEVCT